MEKQHSCISCHTSLTNKPGSAIFPCPQCGESKIIRCFSCRQIAAHYECPSCHFTGPN